MLRVSGEAVFSPLRPRRGRPKAGVVRRVLVDFAGLDRSGESGRMSSSDHDQFDRRPQRRFGRCVSTRPSAYGPGRTAVRDAAHQDQPQQTDWRFLNELKRELKA